MHFVFLDASDSTADLYDLEEMEQTESAKLDRRFFWSE